MDSRIEGIEGPAMVDTSFASDASQAGEMPSFASPAPAPPNLDLPSTPIVQKDDPFAVITNNAPGFKYKYPQAAPTPPNEDDTVWNKVYTAADSRMYNKHGKSATESRKFRESGETRVLALRMLEENKAKHAAGIPPRAKAVKKDAPMMPMPKKENINPNTRGFTPFVGEAMMSISEKIKSEGRARKAPSAAVSSTQGTPVPGVPPKVSQADRSSSVSAPEVKKPVPKKRGTAAPVQKPSKQAGTTSIINRPASQTPAPRQGSTDSSNDGTVYCICRGPDDHRMMVNCEGGCEEWYHCSCVNLNEDDAKKLLDRFICPKCATPGLFTTYRRLCRNFNIKDGDGNPTCREPARVTAEPPSKYCSEECKSAFFAHLRALLRQDDTPSVGGALNVQEVARIFKEKKTFEEFQKLGQKPKLVKRRETDQNHPAGLDYLTPDEKEQLENIQKKQAVIEARIKIYKQYYILLKKVLERQTIAARQPGLDVKDPCCYDNRLSLNESEFKAWAESPEGTASLSDGTLLIPQSPATRKILSKIPYTGQTIPETPILPAALQNVCLRPKKKCKHFNWLKLHNDEFLSTQDRLRKELVSLSRAKDEIVEDAEMREAMRPYYAGNTVTQLF